MGLSRRGSRHCNWEAALGKPLAIAAGKVEGRVERPSRGQPPGAMDLRNPGARKPARSGQRLVSRVNGASRSMLGKVVPRRFARLQRCVSRSPRTAAQRSIGRAASEKKPRSVPQKSASPPSASQNPEEDPAWRCGRGASDVIRTSAMRPTVIRTKVQASSRNEAEVARRVIGGARDRLRQLR
jgi:hypothetical protein